MSRDQEIRGVLFYVSCLAFILGLPFILTYTMGYQFDRNTLKFTRTGLISLKSDPQGASVYLDQVLLNEKTPCSVNEVLPGTHHIRLSLEGYYPYSSDIEVSPSKVSRMEKIILFSLRPDVQQLNKERVSAFWVDEPRSLIYYHSLEDSAIYRSDLDGEHFKLLANFIPLKPTPKKWLFSPGRQKLLYFNNHQIGLIDLQPEGQALPQTLQFVVDYPNDNIQDIFWHADNYHLIIAGEKRICIMEAKPQAEPFVLANLNKRNASVFFDPRNEIIYFSDSQRAEDGKFYDNIYKLELKTKLYPFRDFMRLKPNDREQKD
ncbi:MAG: PEGA domain-containing protein [Candidatus Omnitrophica bacterium]|nr:PEGA domain-containing protein [Candidatus Omnitrophota bacterium]